MNNEETILDPQFNNAESQKTETSSIEQPKAEEKKNVGWGERAAYAAGGAVVGAGMAMAGEVFTARAAEKLELTEEEEGEESLAAVAATAEETSPANETAEEVSGVTVEANGTTVHVTGDAKVEIENGNVHVISGQSAVDQDAQIQHVTPEPGEAIVATSTGIRVAQVDDDQKFSQAFAEARAQVGPGGVFEWHGRVYSTYYKDEWDAMTPEQRHDYQASIDYEDVLSSDSTPHAHQSYHESEAYNEVENVSDSQDASSDDVEVRVLEVGETDLNGDGMLENAAILDVDGNEVLIVDIDQDGIADVALCDIDNDGQLDALDMTGENIAMPDQSDGDAFMSQADYAPDYMNDANVGMYEA